jgi:cytochrome c biogenesis protein CcdA
MGELWLNLGMALWLGILASISPCPLATNIAALSFLSRKASSPIGVLIDGLLYTAGRALGYVLVGVLIVSSLLSILDTAQFLQLQFNKILGPLLIVIGVFLLGFIRLPGFGPGWSPEFGNRLAAIRLVGPLLLGVLFALSFCPVSAGLFFGSLIPISLGAGSSLLLPAFFGIGTAIPVLGFAILIGFGVKGLAGAFGKLGTLNAWARRVTGVVFILAGLYLIVVYVLEWWV